MEKQCGNGTPFAEISEDELTRLVSAEMIKMGFIPSLKGFPCMRELVIVTLKKRGSDKLMKMYAGVAEKLEMRPDALERNTRTLVVNSFYYENGFKNLYEYFGLKEGHCPPTIGQILALFSEYMLEVLFDRRFAL